MSERNLTYADALNEGMREAMAKHDDVVLLGLGVDDPAAVFGSTRGLAEEFGPERVYDIPISEAAVTGVAVGAALCGLRPVLVHLRTEFAMLTLDQIANQAAKWNYMFGGINSIPMVIRMIVGRGWGQSPQHAQNLQAWFAHIPGLKVVAPARPVDAKGLLTAAVEDADPVIMIEHRWLYDVSGPVPEGYYRTPIGQPICLKSGTDVTLIGSSYMTLEACRAARTLAGLGISAEVMDLRTITPLDFGPLIDSVQRTRRVIVCDHATRTAGFAAEVVATLAESIPETLLAPPRRVTLPDSPVPASRALANFYYPRADHIVDEAVMMVLGTKSCRAITTVDAPLDIFDKSAASFL